MPKSRVVQVFIAGAGALLVALVLVGLAGVLVVVADVVEPSGDGWVRFRPGAALGWVVALATTAAVLLLAGASLSLVAWVGALNNAVHLPDKLWFVLLLVTGLTGVGPAGMIAYVVAAPDYRDVPPPQQPGSHRRTLSEAAVP